MKNILRSFMHNHGVYKFSPKGLKRGKTNKKQINGSGWPSCIRGSLLEEVGF